jgi:lipopolysaccharide export LptBFGC system permease protein LptF
MRNRQQGLSLTGLILASIVVVVVAVLSLKLVPTYLQQYTITKILRQIVQNPEFANATAANVRAAFDRQVSIDSVSAISSGDLDISRDAGQLVIEAHYQVTIPLVANVSLLVDFKASSR